MLDFLAQNFTKSPKKSDYILKPVEKELSMLEVNLIKSLYSGNSDLDKIIKYVFSSGGKRLRPALVILFSKALAEGYVSPSQFELAEAIEMIHTASLLHDDVIDSAQTRRGMLTVGNKWGSRTAILAGDYILSRALGKLASIGITAVEMFAGTLNELCIGEMLQKSQNYTVISLEEYINKSERKTAKLFMSGVECAVSILPSANNLSIKAAREYSLNFGIAFQIMDDIINFTDYNKKTGKPAGNDLKNGIVTAPVIFAIQEYEKTGDKTLENLIKNKLKSEKDFKKAMKLVLDSKGIEKARLLGDEYAQKAVDALEVIEDSNYKQGLIDLAYFAIQRNF